MQKENFNLSKKVYVSIRPILFFKTSTYENVRLENIQKGDKNKLKVNFSNAIQPGWLITAGIQLILIKNLLN